MPEAVPTYDRAFADLAYVVLEDSYVLTIEQNPSAVVFVLDARLAPLHERYRPARRGEQHCLARARLTVAGASEHRLRLSGAPPSIDADGELDLGHIDSLTPIDVDGRDTWWMTGDWGELEVTEPSIHLVVLGE